MHHCGVMYCLRLRTASVISNVLSNVLLYMHVKSWCVPICYCHIKRFFTFWYSSVHDFPPADATRDESPKLIRTYLLNNFRNCRNKRKRKQRTEKTVGTEARKPSPHQSFRPVNVTSPKATLYLTSVSPKGRITSKGSVAWIRSNSLSLSF